MQRLILATRNSHKTREVAEMLGGDFAIEDLEAIANAPETEETGKTFEENAKLKAAAISQVVHEMVMADDSGLEVAALRGSPGVRSARYAGENVTDASNVSELLEAMADETTRDARFTCVLALARGGEILATFRGTVYGSIATEARGHGGFGYDPVFVPLGYGQTFAELPAEVKNQLSHRARAIEQLRAYLERSRAD